MEVRVSGPKTAFEAEIAKKNITENEIKQVLERGNRLEIQSTIPKVYELLHFYDRIMTSINATINTIKNKPQLSYQEKKDRYFQHHERELSKARTEKNRIRKLLKNLQEHIK